MTAGPPGLDEVVEIARSLGVELGPEDAEAHLRQLAGELQALAAFVAEAPEEPLPPPFPGARDPGRAPAPGEDPLGAWIWRCRIEGAPHGLLAGLTVALKDHIAVRGVPLTFGARALEGLVPSFDATVTRRVLEEGATIVGKNTLNGLSGGFGFGGAIGDYARPLNPHDPGRLPGGSSSGTAVAVAAREADVGFGGDQGGSIRIPAAWCGTLGLKPTFGLVSHFGAAYGADPGLDTVGPLALRAELVARALQAVAGHAGCDPRQGRGTPVRVDALSGLDGGVAGLRIGLLDEGFAGADDEVRRVVLAAADRLAAAGAVVARVSVPEHGLALRAFGALNAEGALAVRRTGFLGAFARGAYPSEVVVAVNRLWEQRPEVLPPRTVATWILGELARRRLEGQGYAKAHGARQVAAAAFDRALRDADVLLMPTAPVVAPPVELPEGRAAAVEHNLGWLAGSGVARNTIPSSLTGHPALSVPAGRAGGLPVGMQLVGRFLDEPLLLRVAHAYERACDWEEIVAVRRSPRLRA